jgi:tetratricopeptide (TPR) repeat protein
MGEVYLARDLTLDRDVAIKLLTPGRLADPAARRRLLREARSAAALDHPFICPVYDSGETPDGRAYIVMQYVEGPTLSEVLQRGALSVRDTLGICANIAEALAVAHKRGLVHRDLKPSNVIVTPSGAPKLLDLGIAKAIASPEALAQAETQTAVTTEGTIVGTPGYMSPEQIQQRPVDGRSDLFSLGAVLFEGLTGRSPFQARTALETIGNVLHVDPPDPSTLRPGLTDRHDVLCRRLLAKEPANRFQSAEEVTGALRLLLPDAPHTVPPRDVRDTAERTVRRRRRAAIVAAAVLVAGVLAAVVWSRSDRLPPVPPEADVWYQRGTDAIREGAYLTGRTALEQAIELFPQHALAYARLAEADAELDDDGSAQSRLVHLARLVPDESVLSDIERLRVRAVRALVVRALDGSIATYRELVDRRPDEAGAWLDLGRAQETAGLLKDATSSFERAAQLDPQYAAAYLRLGSAYANESNRRDALAAFAEADRLYRAASDVEGQAEVLLRRSAMLDSFGELKEARADLDRALRLAEDANGPYQLVRIRLALAGLTASEGRFADAERMASTAIQEAAAHGLDSVAANGLVDLAWLMQHDRPEEAAARLEQARQLAEKGGARRTIARVRLQRASMFEAEGKPREALALVNEVLPFFRSNRYRQYEQTALAIAARAHQSLDELELAKRMSADVLSIAREVKDEAQEALGARNLASVTAALGQYPEALRLREQSETILRKQGDNATLPYELANRADLLIRLGRFEDADAALGELEKGIAAKLEPYVGRARRAAYLRALIATETLRCDAALAFVRQAASYGPSTETAAKMAPALGAFCDARRAPRTAKPAPVPPDGDPALMREFHYWRAAAALERNDSHSALTEAVAGLKLLGDIGNDELRWRLSGVAALAARRAGNAREGRRLAEVARAAFDRVKTSWNGDFASYERRPDLAALRDRLGRG